MKLTAEFRPFTSFCEGTGNVESDYRLFYKFYRKNYARFLPEDKNARIFVMSCGHGYFLNFLKKLGYKNALGMDADSEKTEYASFKGFACKTGDSLDFLAKNREKFDFIFAEQELNHLTKKEVLLLLDLAKKSLREGGAFLVNSLNPANPLIGPVAPHQNVDHYSFFTGYSLKQIFRFKGFKDAEVFPIDYYVLYSNPLNYPAKALTSLYHLFFKINFKLYGKPDRIFTKKVGGIGFKRKKSEGRINFKKIRNKLYVSNVLATKKKIPKPLLKLYLNVIGPPLVFKRLRVKSMLKHFKKAAPFESVLDLGCGIGDIAVLISDKFKASVLAVDNDLKRIEVARTVARKHGLNVEFKYADLEKRFSPGKKFDCVLASNLMGHIKNDALVFSEFPKFLKDKGFLVLCVDSDTRRIISEEHERKAGHFRSGYNFMRLKKVLEKNGFRVLDYEFIETRDLANKYYYRLNPLLQLIVFPFIYPLILLSDLFPGKRPNMATVLAQKR